MKNLLIAALIPAAFIAGCSAVPTKAASKAASPSVTSTRVVVPDSCLYALDKADRALNYSADGLQYVADAMGAVTRFDPDGISEATSKIEGLSPKLASEIESYRNARDKCKAL
jgi:hypothetical protein